MDYYVSFVETRGQTPTLRGVVNYFNSAVVSMRATVLTAGVMRAMQFELAKKMKANSYQIIILSVIPLSPEVEHVLIETSVEEDEVIPEKKNFVLDDGDIPAVEGI